MAPSRVEHPSYVGMKVPVRLAHQQAHPATVDVGDIQVGVRDAGAELNGAPGAAPAKIKVVPANTCTWA